MKSQYIAFVECQSCQTQVGSSALVVRVGTTQSPASMYHVQLFLATLHGTATDVVFFLMCNSAQLVYVYSCLYVYFIMVMLTLYRNILKLLTNLFAITIPYLIREDQNFQGRTNFTRKYGLGDYFFSSRNFAPRTNFSRTKIPVTDQLTV